MKGILCASVFFPMSREEEEEKKTSHSYTEIIGEIPMRRSGEQKGSRASYSTILL